jgi:hypothetical protein
VLRRKIRNRKQKNEHKKRPKNELNCVILQLNSSKRQLYCNSVFNMQTIPKKEEGKNQKERKRRC